MSGLPMLARPLLFQNMLQPVSHVTSQWNKESPSRGGLLCHFSLLCFLFLCLPQAYQCLLLVPSDSTDGNNFCGSRMSGARRSGMWSFVRQQATRAWDLLSRDTAVWKPGPCLTMKIRESKLRKGMLWPQGLFFVRTRRWDLNPGYLHAFHRVIPGPAVPPTHCMSLAELPSPSCPILPAHIGLSSGRSCACRHRLNQLRGSIHCCLFLSCCVADNSYIPSIALWFLSSFGEPCAKYCWSACWPVTSAVSEGSQRLWSVCSSVTAACHNMAVGLVQGRVLLHAHILLHACIPCPVSKPTLMWGSALKLRSLHSFLSSPGTAKTP